MFHQNITAYSSVSSLKKKKKSIILIQNQLSADF